MQTDLKSLVEASNEALERAALLAEATQDCGTEPCCCWSLPKEIANRIRQLKWTAPA